MKARTFIAVALVGAVLCSVCSCTRPDERVVQSQRERNWLGAEPSAISSAQEPIAPVILPKTHFAAGQLFEQQGQIDQAIIQYRKAVAVSHDYVEAHARLGVLLGVVGRHAEAEVSLRRAVELQPEAAALRNNLGYGYALQGRWADADAELNNAIRLKPDFVRAYVNLGMVLSKMQRFEEAFEAFNAVLPEPDAFYNLGLMFAGQHRYHDAAAAFQHVLTLNPEFAAARQQLDRIAPKLQFETPLEPVIGLEGMVTRANTGNEAPPAAKDRDGTHDDAPGEAPLAVLTESATGIADEDQSVETQGAEDTAEATPCPDDDLAWMDEGETEQPIAIVEVYPPDDAIPLVEPPAMPVLALLTTEAYYEDQSVEIEAAGDATDATPCPDEDLAWMDEGETDQPVAIVEVYPPDDAIPLVEPPAITALGLSMAEADYEDQSVETQGAEDTAEATPCPDEDLAWMDEAETEQPIALVEVYPPADAIPLIEPPALTALGSPAADAVEADLPAKVMAINDVGNARPQDHLAWINRTEADQPIALVEASSLIDIIEVIERGSIIAPLAAEALPPSDFGEVYASTIAQPQEMVAQLTSAERILGGELVEEAASDALGAAQMPFWPRTYDPCELADEAVWFEPVVPAWAHRGAFAPGGYSAWADVVPITLTASTTEIDIPGWVSAAEADRQSDTTKTQAEPSAKPSGLYAPAPELTMDESVGWYEPCPPNDMVN